MFRILGNAIYYKGYLAAQFDPKLPASVRTEVEREIKEHTPADHVASMVDKIAELECDLCAEDAAELLKDASY